MKTGGNDHNSNDGVTDPGSKKSITVQVSVNVPLEKAWQFWVLPEHIKNWNHASDDWHTTNAKNDLTVGGRFSYRMEAKDGTSGFDFQGTYTKIVDMSEIRITLADSRKVAVSFKYSSAGTLLTESFDPEEINDTELQRNGWQAILNNYKRYAEEKSK